MQIRIKRVDKSLPLPQYYTSGAVAFDLYAREDSIIKSGEVYRIPINLIIEVPAGYMLYIKDRSSTAKKKGLLCTPGFIDQDFHGPLDEILIQVYNFTKESVKVERGERIGQASFIKIDTAVWEEYDDDLKNDNRGGFGTTGK